MRDSTNFQTPQKDHSLANRRSKSVSDHSKKPLKVSKKSLNSAFSAATEDGFALELPKDSADFTSISEISDDNQLIESADNLIASVSQATSIESEVFASSDLSPLSSTITSHEYKSGIVSINECRIGESEGVKFSCIEAELVVKHLKEAQLQMLNAGNINLQSKRFLDALVNVVIEEFMGMPEEKDWFNELISRKSHLVFLSFILWTLVVSVIFFFFSGSKHAFNGATPT